MSKRNDHPLFNLGQSYADAVNIEIENTEDPLN